jgi:DNA-binding NarL/FixJ family response regulator
VLIAEGQGLARAGLRVLLDGQHFLRVSAEGATRDEAVAASTRDSSDLVRMDFELPDGGGVSTPHRGELRTLAA